MPIVHFCDTDKGGATKRINVPQGTTIQKFIDQKKPDFNPENYNVRHNHNTVTDYNTELQEDDTLNFSRSKLAGAT